MKIKNDAGKEMISTHMACMKSTKPLGESFHLRDLKCTQISSKKAISVLKSSIGKCTTDKCRDAINKVKYISEQSYEIGGE